MNDSPGKIFWRHPSHMIGLGFGSGLSPVAPGTVGTLWAWISFLVIDPWMSDGAWAALLVWGFLIGIWACTRTGRALGEVDSSSIVWDEILAFWCVLWLLPNSRDPAGFFAMGPLPEWLIQLAAFLLFRFFDIAKPAPIRQIDRASTDGWGVMLDDLVAAAYTLISCAILMRLVQMWGPWQ